MMDMSNTDNTAPIARFEVGRTYIAGAGRDYSWTCEVIARTAKFVTVRIDGDEIARIGVKISTMSPTEWAMPLGSYSQAPCIHADRPVAVAA